MKIFILLFLVVSELLFCAELKHITIGNQDFSVTTETYDIYDSKGEVMRLYAEENNNDLTFLLSLVLEDKTGTCADKSMQEGAYEINGTQITLYSFWDRKGRAYDAPYGARIQQYEMLANGTLKRVSSKVYIESQRRNYNQENGMKYLFHAPNDKQEKEALNLYINTVERDYKGTFVYGMEAMNLIKEVENALKRKTKTRWQ